ALDRQLALLEAGVRRAFDDEADVRAALVPDMQGIGSGPDVVAVSPALAEEPRELPADRAGDLARQQ
ncbi:MAG: hypothetical protein QOF82_1967, partial [Frankiales bacterium]|nr:hypothetical protein [Frankiales bacterium]